MAGDTLDRACAIVGTQTVAGHLADLAVACWGHLMLGDILPLLRFSDPAEAERTPETLGKDVVQKLFSGVFERLLEPAPEAVPAPSRPDRPDRPLPELIDELFGALDDRQRAIARDRLYATQRATLDELAQRFSVTRERIRQIERDLRDHVESWLGRPEAAALVAHVTWLRGRLGSAAPADDLQATVPWHRTELRTLGIPAWRFVRTLLTGYEQADGWLVAGGSDELRRRRASSSPTGRTRSARPCPWCPSSACARTSPSGGSWPCHSCACWASTWCRGRAASTRRPRRCWRWPARRCPPRRSRSASARTTAWSASATSSPPTSASAGSTATSTG
ncbi:sigma factor-like helix-turn-helix DNA-binding protein [Nonomuraea rubra]|uniref:sigma factor-like helix-turn-helix DNA-binding protein n=1 Tax=Nonomuraea rubra TaxID=46180 RepID=UPI00360E912B